MHIRVKSLLDVKANCFTLCQTDVESFTKYPCSNECIWDDLTKWVRKKNQIPLKSLKITSVRVCQLRSDLENLLMYLYEYIQYTKFIDIFKMLYNFNE